MSGRPAATTKLATDTPFSSEKNPTAWDTTSERRITSRKATRTTAAAMPSAGVGSEREWTGRLPTTKNPNTEMAMASSTMVATPRRLLAATSTPGVAQQSQHDGRHQHDLEHERQPGEHVELGAGAGWPPRTPPAS